MTHPIPDEALNSASTQKGTPMPTPDALQPQSLEQLKELSEKATPGPLSAEPGAKRGAWIKGSDGNWFALACGNDDDTAEANASLLVASVNYVRSLLTSSPGTLEEAAPLADIAAERCRQIEVEGWTPEHDDTHKGGELARAAAVYAVEGGRLFTINHLQVPQQVWPYRWEYVPKDRRRDLVRAGALIVAEIERLDRLGASKPLDPPHRQQASFQARVDEWLLSCFGEEIARDRIERNHRFLEEALELVQAGGCTASDAHQLVDYTFSRPVGELGQEVGGVMNTLAALCLAYDLDMVAEGNREMDRVSDPATMARIRAKQAAKPKHSPLPEHVQASGEDDPSVGREAGQ